MFSKLDKLDHLKGEVTSLHISDLHWDKTPPRFRSLEKDIWWQAQLRPLREVCNLQEKFHCPVVVAGDLFHKWNADPETISFAIEQIKVPWYAIPGNHDLKHHNLEDLPKTAFCTLVKAGKIIPLEYDKPLEVGDVVLHGFPYGTVLKPCPTPSRTFVINVAVVHTYVWTAESEGGGASDENRLKSIREQLGGYDVIHFGDNHKTFLIEGRRSYFNPGSFQIRNSDQREHRPCVGLLQRNHKFHLHYLNCDQDQYLDIEPEEEKKLIDMTGFIEEINNLSSELIDFKEIVMDWLRRNPVSKGVETLLLQHLEKKK